MSIRFDRYKNLPEGIKPLVEAAALGYSYNEDKVGGPDWCLEPNQILLYTCMILAGQKFAKLDFPAMNVKGSKLQKEGETLATAWLKERLQNGFHEWESHIDLHIIALSTLADLSKNETVREYAAILLDKMLLTLGVHSFKGIFSMPQASTRASDLKTGRFHPAESLNYLLFGVGNYNDHLAAPLCLAIAKNYQLPELIRSIALDQRDDVWCKEIDAAGGQRVRKAFYKMPDYVISSVQDYRPGERGFAEQTWSARLSQEAVVFTSHPGSINQTKFVQPGFWLGNGVLPRIAQHRDSLIALYNLPENEPLAFTHAYFPAFCIRRIQFRAGLGICQAWRCLPGVEGHASA